MQGRIIQTLRVLLLSLVFGVFAVGCGSSHHSGGSGGGSSGFSITTTVLPAAIVSTSYNATIATSGGTAPVVFNVSFGALPVGLTLFATGQIIGTPTRGHESQTFTITASDAQSRVTSQQYTLTVGVPFTGITTTPTPLPSGTVGSAYSASLTASGGTPPFTWSVFSGTLPPGLSLNASTGAITGTPTYSGTFPVSFQVRDSVTPPAVGVLSNLSIVVN